MSAANDVEPSSACRATASQDVELGTEVVDPMLSRFRCLRQRLSAHPSATNSIKFDRRRSSCSKLSLLRGEHLWRRHRVPRELLPNALQDVGEAFGRLVRRTLVERITLAASPSLLAAPIRPGIFQGRR